MSRKEKEYIRSQISAIDHHIATTTQQQHNYMQDEDYLHGLMTNEMNTLEQKLCEENDPVLKKKYYDELTNLRRVLTRLNAKRNAEQNDANDAKNVQFETDLMCRPRETKKSHGRAVTWLKNALAFAVLDQNDVMEAHENTEFAQRMRTSAATQLETAKLRAELARFKGENPDTAATDYFKAQTITWGAYAKDSDHWISSGPAHQVRCAPPQPTEYGL